MPPTIENVKLFINFFNVIDYKTITGFIETLQRALQGFIFNQGQLKKNIEEINILMSCPGGFLEPAIVAYNFLSQYPIKTNAYNLHNVDSAGVVLFCGVGKRYSLPDARFLIHDVSRKFEGNQEEGNIKQLLEMALFTKDNMFSILAKACDKKEEEIEQMILKRKGDFDSQKAKEFGLIDGIEIKIPSPSEKDIILSIR